MGDEPGHQRQSRKWRDLAVGTGRVRAGTGSDRDDGLTIPGCRGVANQLNVVASMPYDEQVGS